MARDLPMNETEFGRVSGVGEQKRKEFSEVFVNEILAHRGESKAAPPEPYDVETMFAAE